MKLNPVWCVAVVLVLPGLPLSAAETVLVVRPPDDRFDEAVTGLRDELEPDMRVLETVVGETSGEGEARRLFGTGPSAVVLMDNDAISLYRDWEAGRSDTSRRAPVVALMAIDVEREIGGIANATGISYEVPIVTALVQLRALGDRSVSRVGVIHREILSDFVARNREYCRREGFEIVAVSCPDALDGLDRCVRDAVRGLLVDRKVDALWLPNDNAMFTPAMVERVWRPGLAGRATPVVVGVEVLVNPSLGVGSFAVLPDHRALGSQAAEMVLYARDNGWSVQSHAVDPPVSVRKVLGLAANARAGETGRPCPASVDTCLWAETGEVALSSTNVSNGQLSLGSLLSLQVTSVTKRPERMMSVPTAIYVITADDIRRTGITRLQDALRLVPGAWTSDVTYNEPATGIRSSSNVFSTSINMLLDGVPMTNPVTGGVYYTGVRVPMDQIERIEVIRGPGGTIYGVNSATGIVNIITKAPADSEGGYARMEGGSGAHGSAMLRYGKRLRNSMSAGLYAGYSHDRGFEQNEDFSGERLVVEGRTIAGTIDTTTIDNAFTDDEEGRTRSLGAGLSLDGKLGDRAMLRGRVWYQGSFGNEYSSAARDYPAQPDILNARFEADLLPRDSVWLENTWSMNTGIDGKVTWNLTDNHRAFVHCYYLYTASRVNMTTLGTFIPRFTAIEMEVQDDATFFAGKPVELSLVSGANVRPVLFDIGTPAGRQERLREARNTEYIVAGFAQGTARLHRRVALTVGAKAETWTLIDTKPEVSPSVKLSVTPLEELTLWSAWSRSVTTPGYMYTNSEARVMALPPGTGLWPLVYRTALGLDTVPAGAGKWVAFVGTDEIKPADFRTTEGGVRFSPVPRLVFDVSGFYTLSRGSSSRMPIDLNKVVPSEIVPGDTIVPLYFAASVEARSYGLESILRLTPVDFVRLELSHSWYRRREEGRMIPGTDRRFDPDPDTVCSTPEHVVRTRVYVDFPNDLSFGVAGLWHSSYYNTMPYDHIRQTYSADALGYSGTNVTEAGFQLDLTVEKRFFGDRLTLYGWGRNLLTDQKVEAYSWYLSTYPHTVNRMFGGGVRVKF